MERHVILVSAFYCYFVLYSSFSSRIFDTEINLKLLSTRLSSCIHSKEDIYLGFGQLSNAGPWLDPLHGCGICILSSSWHNGMSE